MSERLSSAGEGRLSDPQTIRRTTQGTRIGKANEGLELFEVHDRAFAIR